MAIYHDDFEGYVLGASTPFGDFTASPNQATIVADNYLPAGTQALETRNGFSEVAFTNGAAFTSGTLYVGFSVQTAFNNGALVRFFNHTPFTASPHAVATLSLEQDGTFSLYQGARGLTSMPIATSGDVSLKLARWYWLQFNITLADVGGFLQITYDVCLEGKTLMSGTYLSTTLTIVGLPSGLADFDHIALSNGVHWDEFTFDTLQAANTFPNPGAPELRGSTGLIEVVEALDSAKIRFSCGLIELIISTDNHVYEA